MNKFVSCRKPGRRRLNPDIGDAHSIRDESALTAEGVDEGDGEIEEEMIDGFAILSFKTLAELRVCRSPSLAVLLPGKSRFSIFLDC